MICRFEHDGDCCNSGATQFMRKCKQPCDTIVPMTNADRIRAMSDEELTVFINKIVICHQLRNAGNCKYCPIYGAKPCDTEGVLAWLQQPAQCKAK